MVIPNLLKKNNKYRTNGKGDKMIQGIYGSYSDKFYTVIDGEIVCNYTHKTVDWVKR